MSAKNGLIGFGISAVLIAGGAGGLLEGKKFAEERDSLKACRLAENAGIAACREHVDSLGVINDKNTEMEVALVAGGLAIGLGGFGAAGSLVVTLSDSKLRF